MDMESAPSPEPKDLQGALDLALGDADNEVIEVGTQGRTGGLIGNYSKAR